ncbi:hypothetical protein BGX24_008633 [Mortierella sp. AD032]|nr:hypothetical protein BGX24_008633 [Mortierella sp. AD032]
MGIDLDCIASNPNSTALYGIGKAEGSHEKDGVETVIHAVMDETASVIRFGLVDQSIGYLQLAAVWKLVDSRFMVGELTDKIPKLPNPKATTYKTDYSPSAPVYSDQRHMVYMNGTLYMCSDSTGLISSFPFPSEESNMAMLLTTIDLINPNPNTTTTTAWMNSWGSYKDVAMFQAIGGYLQGQEPFAVGLAVDGYYGMTLGGSSMGNIVPFENGTSTIVGVEWRYFRSRFRNHNNQVVPGYKYPISMDSETQLGVVIGGIVGLLVLANILWCFDGWLTRTRLAKEKHDADRNSYELIARVQHASISSGDSGVGRGGNRFVSSPTAGVLALSMSPNTSAHTLFDGLGPTRHPRPTTVVTIGDDDEPVPTLVDIHTQSSS